MRGDTLQRKAEDLEGEALRLCHEAKQGRKVKVTAKHLLALQKFYQDRHTVNHLRGHVLETNHP